MRTWVDQFPGRLEYELREFADRGLKFELDEPQLEQQGRVVLTGMLPHQGEEIELEVRYPDLFPYLRPEVVAPDLKLGRHQDPYDKNLCLLDPSTRDWDSDESAASLVADRVPHLLSLLAPGAEDELREAETPQGEPASIRFPHLPGTVVFVPAAALALSGTARAGSGRIAFSIGEPPRIELRGLLAELIEKSSKGKAKTLAKVEETLGRNFGGEQVAFRWVRLPEAPAENTVDAVLEAIEVARPGFGSPPWHAVPGGRIAIAGIVFREEVAQGESGDAWVFAVRVRHDSEGEGAYLVRGQPLSRESLEDRLPPQVRLGASTVSLIGLGSVGSGLAIELARAGIAELRGMDPDTVEAGTTVRWALGQSAAGRWKAGAIARRIAQDYPYTLFQSSLHQLGQSAHRRTARDRSEIEVLEAFLSGADLLIDATAEIGVQHALADLATEKGMPQLYISSTEGARGGLVARVLPGVTGCWLCLQHHLDDNKTIPAPARDEAGTVQPRGCATTTFVGAGFDILPVIAQGARVAASTLSGDWQIEAEQEERHDVFVCSFGEDRLLPPRWSAHALIRHPRCKACAQSHP
jgi:molybdopterin/thiamine biosynthesis adenylyltransferase